MAIGAAGYAAYAAIAAAAVSGYASYKTTQATAQQAVEDSKIAAADAGYQLDAAAAQADQIREAAKRQRAAARAALSASGVSVDVGSAIKIDQEITRGGEYDALQAILGADRNAATTSKEIDSRSRYASKVKQAGQWQTAGTVLSMAASSANASGWRSNGPGYSGTQAPAPVFDRSIRVGG